MYDIYIYMYIIEVLLYCSHNCIGVRIHPLITIRVVHTFRKQFILLAAENLDLLINVYKKLCNLVVTYLKSSLNLSKVNLILYINQYLY